MMWKKEITKYWALPSIGVLSAAVLLASPVTAYASPVTDVPVDTPINTQVDTPINTQVDTPIDTPVDNPVQAEIELPEIQTQPDTTPDMTINTDIDVDTLWENSSEVEIIHSEEVIDSYTGLTQSELEQLDMIDTAIGDHIYVAADCYYDANLDEYTFAIGDHGTAVQTNIIEGMITRDPVYFRVAEGLPYVLYLNNVEQEEPNLSAISEPGQYTLRVTADAGEKKNIHFQIVGQETNLNFYTMPEGCTVLEVTHDGADVHTESDSVEFTEEGHYELSYICGPASKNYLLSVDIDRTAPTLALKEVNERGEARQAVDISDFREQAGASIEILLNGEPMKYQAKLTDSGSYNITVSDPAGNSRTYSFTILVYLTFSSIAVIVLLILMIGSLIAYIMISRKRIRVR